MPTYSCGTSSTYMTILQEQQVMQFLMGLGLNDAYKHVRGNILMMQPLPTLSQAYRLILQEESQRECTTVFPIGNESTALAAYNNKSSSNNTKWANGNSNGQTVTFGIAPNDRRSKFFSLIVCFGDIANPSLRDNRDNWDNKKRAANCAQSDTPSETSSVMNPTPSPSRTQEQITQLMSLLSMHNLTPQTDSSTDMPSAFMAGSFNEASSGPW